jgi:hypothetical protein
MSFAIPCGECAWQVHTANLTFFIKYADSLKFKNGKYITRRGKGTGDMRRSCNLPHSNREQMVRSLMRTDTPPAAHPLTNKVTASNSITNSVALSPQANYTD